jgi:Transposase DDE domain
VFVQQTDSTKEERLNEIEAFVRAMVEGIVPQPMRKGPGRPLVLPHLCLWSSFLVGVLRGLGSQAAVWRLLAVHGLWDYPRFDVCDQAVRNRLEQGGAEAMERFFGQVTSALADRLLPYADTKLAGWASAVVALDETTLDSVARKLPSLRGTPAGDDALLAGKVAGLFDLRLQQWRKLMWVDDVRSNEKLRARSLVEDLPKGSLVLADLGYFGFEWFDFLIDSGHEWVSRLKKKTSYEVRHVFYEHGTTLDALIWLGAHRSDRAAKLVRLVRFTHKGQQFEYITSVLAPKQLPLAEIARLYARRWDIELAIKLVKRELGLHLFWSAKTEIVQAQVWAAFAIAQILMGLRQEVAARAGVDPFEVSMKLMIEWLPRLGHRGEDPIEVLVQYGRKAKIIRHSRRLEIRAPTIRDEDIVPLPPDLPLERTPRYARRKCGPRTK